MQITVMPSKPAARSLRGFAGLEAKGRSVAEVCRLVQDLAIRTLDRLEP